jgi:hypothetical protein
LIEFKFIASIQMLPFSDVKLIKSHFCSWQIHGRYAVAVNVIVCAYSIAQSFGEIRRLISPTFIFRSRPSYYCSLFLDQASVCVLIDS